MAMPALLSNDWTAERALALPNDGNRYEVLDGALAVTPAPTLRHQSIVEEFGARLRAYAHGEGIGRLFRAPADIVFGPRRLVQPDLFIVPRQVPQPMAWKEVTSLLLAVEVVSPSTARVDRQHKRIVYQTAGVAEYWVIDGDAREVERWRPTDRGPEIVQERLVWLPTGASAPLTLDLRACFDEVLGTARG